MGQDDVRGERNQFRGMLAHGLGITAAPSVIDQDVVRWSNPVVGDALSWVAPPLA